MTYTDLAVLTDLHWLDPGVIDNLSNDIAIWYSLMPLTLLTEYLPFIQGSGARQIVALGSTSMFGKANSTDPREVRLVNELMQAEHALLNWSEQHEIIWTILRPTMTYGLNRDNNVAFICRFISRF